MANIFAYGSLMIPVVMRTMTGHDFVSIEAFLRDHARYKIKGESYPGIIREKGAMTQRLLFLDLDRDAVKRLDDFEGVCYERTPVKTETWEGKILEAETYVFKHEFSGLLTRQAWDLETFQREHLKAFLVNYNGFQNRR